MSQSINEAARTGYTITIREGGIETIQLIGTNTEHDGAILYSSSEFGRPIRQIPKAVRKINNGRKALKLPRLEVMYDGVAYE